MDTVDVRDQLVNVAQKVRKCPTITLMRAYNRAYRDFCSQTHWLTAQISGATQANVPEYNLGTDDNLDIIGIKGMQGTITNGDGSKQSWVIGPADPSGFDPNYQPSLSGQYAYVTQGRFVLFPTPNQVFQVLLSAIITPKETATLIPAAPLVVYSNEVEAGALAYLLDIPGMPWSNPVLAEKNARIFRAAIANAKAEVQRSFNTGSQRARPRGFVR